MWATEARRGDFERRGVTWDRCNGTPVKEHAGMKADMLEKRSGPAATMRQELGTQGSRRAKGERQMLCSFLKRCVDASPAISFDEGLERAIVFLGWLGRFDVSQTKKSADFFLSSTMLP